MNIYFLHGFLGQPADFDQTLQGMKRLIQSHHLFSVNYLQFRETSPEVSLKEWGGEFNQWVDSYEKSHPCTRRILVGYSQGGRLALQAWKAKPDFWQGLVLISTNPGIPWSERATRFKNDQDWSRRFQTENFAKTVEKWNAQSVFEGSVTEPERQECDHNRRMLGRCLENWSLAHQEDFRSELVQQKKPVLYVSGDRDSKYQQIGQELAQMASGLKSIVISDSGHRVIFDAPESLAKVISDFSQDL